MTTVLREHDRKSPLAPLAPGAAAMLARVFSQHGAEPRAEDVESAWRLLGTLRDRHHWLACGCSAPSPVLIPRRREQRMELVRRHGDVHDTSCPFHAVRTVARSSPSEPAGFLILRSRHDLESTDVLKARLWRLLDAALLRSGVQRVRGDQIATHRGPQGTTFHHVDVLGHYLALGEAASALPTTIGTWGDGIARHVNGISGLRRRMTNETPNARIPVQGVFLGQVDSLGERRKAWAIERAPDRQVWFTEAAELAGDAGGPYLGAGVFAVHEDGKVRGIVGVARSIYSRGLLITVGDAVERSVLRVLLEQMVYWQRDRACTVVIDRPESHAGSPSFKLTTPAGRSIGVWAAEATDAVDAAAHAKRMQAAGAFDEVLVVDGAQIGELDTRKRLTGWVLKAAG